MKLTLMEASKIDDDVVGPIKLPAASRFAV
jgi:hypothetical protein